MSRKAYILPTNDTQLMLLLLSDSDNNILKETLFNDFSAQRESRLVFPSKLRQKVVYVFCSTQCIPQENALPLRTSTQLGAHFIWSIYQIAQHVNNLCQISLSRILSDSLQHTSLSKMCSIHLTISFHGDPYRKVRPSRGSGCRIASLFSGVLELVHGTQQTHIVS